MDRKRTFINISKETRQRLRESKIYRRESYDDVIVRLLSDEEKKEVC